jgi:hypothetical protein
MNLLLPFFFPKYLKMGMWQLPKFGQYIDFASFRWKHLASNDNATKNVEVGLRPSVEVLPF